MTQAEACRLHIIKSCLDLPDPLFPAGQETQMRQDPPLIQPKTPQVLPTPEGQPSSNLLTPAPGTRQKWQRSSQSTEMGWTSFFWKFSPAVLPLHLQLKLGWTVSVKDDAEKVFVWLVINAQGTKIQRVNEYEVKSFPESLDLWPLNPLAQKQMLFLFFVFLIYVYLHLRVCVFMHKTYSSAFYS